MFVPEQSTLVPYDNKNLDPLLYNLLSVVSPHGTESYIKQVVRNYIDKFPIAKTATIQELDDNLLIRVGGAESKSIFSCHMDTVSMNSKANEEANKLDRIQMMTPVGEQIWCQDIIYGAKEYTTAENILEYIRCTIGADDKLGVYILTKMIENQIPGLYLFHVGEERGGIGSGNLAKRTDIFEGYKRAIAFDRANYGDVICFQRGKRCCSKEFGKELADMLNVYMPPKEQFSSEVTGTFTDTANYTKLVPECTNMSVGYFNQHSSAEHFDWIWLKNLLLPAILKIKFEELPVHRDPAIEESVYSSYTYINNWQKCQKIMEPKKQLNETKINWATIDKDVAYINLPDWEPEMGYIEEAHPNVLLRCIQSYFQKCPYVKLERLAEFYFNSLEDRILLEEEIEDLTEQNKLLKAKLLELNSDIPQKLEYVQRLVDIGKSNTIKIDPASQKKMQGYLLGAQAVLKNKLPFNNKTIRKLNRLIFNLAYFISLDTREEKPADQSKLLLEIHKYITSRITEEGFAPQETVH